MKLFYLLMICTLGMATAQNTDKKFQFTPPEPQKNFQFTPPEPQKNLPTVTGSVEGSRKQGFDVNIDANHKIWESQNKRHSFDASAGYRQHLGGPYGNGRPDYKVGAGYTFRFRGKK